MTLRLEGGTRVPSQSLVAGPRAARCSTLPARRRALKSAPCRCAARGRSRLHIAASSSSSQPEGMVEAPMGRNAFTLRSYDNVIDKVAASVKAAMADGVKRMEVEFPPFPDMDSYKGASDVYIDANVQYAMSLAAKVGLGEGKRARVILPDAGEFRRSSRIFKSALEMQSAVDLGSLSETGGDWAEDFRQSLNSLFGSTEQRDQETVTEDDSLADLYIIVNASCTELLDVEKFVNKFAPDVPVVLMNMELETLRGDLGLLAFPPKDLHYRFLSAFKPVFFVRQRDYSKSVPVSPYLVNYSGALFREYPNPWEVLLRKDEDYYAVDERKERYTLTEAKYSMMEACGLRTEEEGSGMEFLRRGYKTCTWWEDPVDFDKEQSQDWRT